MSSQTKKEADGTLRTVIGGRGGRETFLRGARHNQHQAEEEDAERAESVGRVAANPLLVRWARERAGYSLDDLSESYQVSQWEQGTLKPTFTELEKFSKKTHTPIGYFFLSEPPNERMPSSISDFRVVGNAEIVNPSINLLDTVYLCQQRQDWYREEVIAAGEQPLSFVGSLTTSEDETRAAETIRSALNFDVTSRTENQSKNGALNEFIERADTLGILVMVSGCVGSNTHRGLDVEEFRGFALSDSLAPLVFINNKDARAAQMFTLAHELAHIWLGHSGISNVGVDFPPDHAVERWCNQVAAELLVPSSTLRRMFRTYDYEYELIDQAENLAEHFKVSVLVILRRLYSIDAVPREHFQDAYDEVLADLQAFSGRANRRYHETVLKKTGQRLARALVISTLEGRTSYTESFRLLGIKKSSHFDNIAQAVGVIT